MASSGAGDDGRRGPEDLFRFVCVDCVCRRRATSEHFDHLLGVDFGVGPVAVDNGRRSLLFFFALSLVVLFSEASHRMDSDIWNSAPLPSPPPRLGLPSARPATPVKKLGTQNSVRDQVEPDRRRGRETRDGGVATPGVDNWIRLREGARVSTTTTTSVHFATGDEDVDGAEGRPVSSSNDDF